MIKIFKHTESYNHALLINYLPSNLAIIYTNETEFITVIYSTIWKVFIQNPFFWQKKNKMHVL